MDKHLYVRTYRTMQSKQSATSEPPSTTIAFIVCRCYSFLFACFFVCLVLAFATNESKMSLVHVTSLCNLIAPLGISRRLRTSCGTITACLLLLLFCRCGAHNARNDICKQDNVGSARAQCTTTDSDMCDLLLFLFYFLFSHSQLAISACLSHQRFTQFLFSFTSDCRCNKHLRRKLFMTFYWHESTSNSIMRQRQMCGTRTIESQQFVLLT